MENYFEIGVIVNTQGIKGDVRVLPKTDDKTRFELLKEITAVFSNGNKQFDIERVWYHKNFVILKLKGINDMNAAELLKGGVIVVPPELALPLSDGQYYIRDLIGMTVTTTNGELLGVISQVLETGANDVFLVKTNGADILIPHIKQCIVNVDVANKTMVVELLEGLR